MRERTYAATAAAALGAFVAACTRSKSSKPISVVHAAALTTVKSKRARFQATLSITEGVGSGTVQAKAEGLYDFDLHRGKATVTAPAPAPAPAPAAVAEAPPPGVLAGDLVFDARSIYQQ